MAELPAGAIKQQFAFKPNHLVKSGRQALFKPVYGVPFTADEKKERPKKNDDEPKAFKKEFT